MIDDLRDGPPAAESIARRQRPSLAGLRPDRSIFAGKRYLPWAWSRPAAAATSGASSAPSSRSSANTQTRRPIDDILDEIRRIKKPLFFFVDDNITSNMDQAKEFFRALIPLKIRWVSQASINAAHDEEFLRADQGQRLPGRAHRLRDPQSGQPAADEQVVQH